MTFRMLAEITFWTFCTASMVAVCCHAIDLTTRSETGTLTRYAMLAVITFWTASMAAVFGFGLYLLVQDLKFTVIAGKPALWGNQPMGWTASLVSSLLIFGIYLGFSGGCVFGGAKLVRVLWRDPDVQPEVVPLPCPCGDILVVRRPSFAFSGFFLLFAVVGWSLVFLGAAELLGWILTGGGGRVPLVGGDIIPGVIFAAIGTGTLFGGAVTVAFDLRQRTWRITRGIRPLQFIKAGDLDEASKVAVVEETRQGGDGPEVRVVVARLVWSNPSRRALALTERPNAIDGLRRPLGYLRVDYRPAVRLWALELANLLALPIVDETKTVLAAGGADALTTELA